MLFSTLCWWLISDWLVTWCKKIWLILTGRQNQGKRGARNSHLTLRIAQANWDPVQGKVENFTSAFYRIPSSLIKPLEQIEFKIWSNKKTGKGELDTRWIFCWIVTRKKVLLKILHYCQLLQKLVSQIICVENGKMNRWQLGSPSLCWWLFPPYPCHLDRRDRHNMTMYIIHGECTKRATVK